MKTRILGMVLVLALLATLRGQRKPLIRLAQPNTGQTPATTYVFPSPADEVTGQASEPQTVAPTGLQRSQAGQAIIIDHTTTDISKIPDYWIEQAKKVAVHYAHTSHGSQVLSGLTGWKDRIPSTTSRFELTAQSRYLPIQAPCASMTATTIPATRISRPSNTGRLPTV